MAGSFEQTKEDLQRTVREIIRVILYRRWSFLIPFCMAATVVFISSHNLPRVYKAHTIFERSNPIPLTNVIQKKGPESISAFQRDMKFDMLGEESMLRVVDKLGLSKDLLRNPDGSLTEAGQRQRKAKAQGLRGALSSHPTHSSPDLDRVQIEATASDPELVVKLANAVRENYFEVSKSRFLGMLADARAFYQGEIEMTLADIEQLDNKLEAMEEKFPWINPDKRNSTRDKIFMDKIKMENLENSEATLRREIALLESRLKSMPIPKLLVPQDHLMMDMEMLDTDASREAERRRLRMVILKTMEQQEQLRVKSQMKPAHPEIQRLKREERYARVNLNRLNEKMGERPVALDKYTEDPVEATVLRQDRANVEFELTTKRVALSEVERKLEEAKAASAKFEKERNTSLAKQSGFRKFQHAQENALHDLEELRNYERQIARVLDVDSKKHGIMFKTIKEAQTTRRPILPKSRTIILLALGVGLAFGACTVFLREFFDHTFHTANAVSYSLGVQILEGIDEILLPGDRQRLLLKRLAIVPIACLFLGAFAASGMLAHMSIENPEKYQRIVNKAKSVWEEMSFVS